ncbi:FliR [Acetoanaerobium sticklandii]|uniref:Flagellar biosynthetic protein FliR n=1 Tax=Acetoanaerobium sticklandii (strain ATCC 12662 / DSM 519 / JCM 1433 / CCUG 9281 / NCIMB 10654 / HF) TaxID=499177 RepID=E3PSI7_ACESD|nr:flagellar biosynthetic protein FliR [Acetoanaerobium sticklandii]CBH21841.1 FliR [Acetoanaerobium sticklandii]
MINELFTTVITSINVFLLILSRVIGFISVAPVYGRNGIPLYVKIGLSIIVSYIILPFLVFEISTPIGSPELIFMSFKEVITGLGLGLIAQLFFSIFASAGAIIDMELGLSMSQVYDPQIGGQVTVTSKFLDIFAYLIFLYIDGHHYLMRAIINSFYILPLGSAQISNDNFINFTSKLVSYIFVSAITIAIPIIISIFLGNLLLAFMAKIMPQMNVFIVGMPFKIFLGLIIFIISLPYIGEVIRKILMNIYEYLYLFLEVVKG